MIIDPVTQRYADALWSLAKEKGALLAVISDVKRLATVVSMGTTRDAITNPRRDREERRKLVLASVGTMNPMILHLIGLLFDKNREAVLLGLSDAFHKLELEAAGAVEGIVESARPLGDAEVKHLAASLSVHFGKTLALENKIVPELVGGARVIAGNRMIDYSVQGRLDALRKKMMDAPLSSRAPARDPQ